MKTNLTRLLDSRKIAYTVYELPRQKFTALEIAQRLEVPPEIVYKTLVILRKEGGKPILAIVPGNSQVDLKAVAQAVGEKKALMSSQREAECLTKLKAGGISALALLNRGFQVLIDQSADQHPEIIVSGGQLGMQIRLSPADLATLTKAQMANIAAPSV